MSSPIGLTLKAALAALESMVAFCMATEVAKAPAWMRATAVMPTRSASMTSAFRSWSGWTAGLLERRARLDMRGLVSGVVRDKLGLELRRAIIVARVAGNLDKTFSSKSTAIPLALIWKNLRDER